MTAPELVAAIAEAPAEELPALAMALAARLAQVNAKPSPLLSSTVDAEPAERVLTYAEAAAVLGCRETYVETLVRQHKLPSVPLPGTDRPGKAREGKFRRILLSSLLAHLKAREEKAIDTDLSATLKSARDRRRVAKNPKAPRVHSDRVRQADRGALRDGLALGDRGATDSAHGREAGEAAGGEPRLGT